MPVTFGGQSLLRKGQSRLRRGQSGLRRAEEPSLGTGYIVRVRKIGLIEAGYRDLVRKSRSRASSSRDDCLFLLHVILMIQARIAIFGAF
ncbi:MAG: hypothetical protein XD94_1742 [Mesotoga prima]|uniref:Uncharacterized protein n=1 Tax=Mesotoga prima TaxID=1184387 RepID=A0A117M106_9BACT|nr:MAG: hypothetical protein XD94_1742 [Mesotoga prima]